MNRVERAVEEARGYPPDMAVSLNDADHAAFRTALPQISELISSIEFWQLRLNLGRTADEFNAQKPHVRIGTLAFLATLITVDDMMSKP